MRVTNNPFLTTVPRSCNDNHSPLRRKSPPIRKHQHFTRCSANQPAMCGTVRGKPGANRLGQRSAVACQLLSHRGKPGANKLGQRSAVACQLLSHRGKPGANRLGQRSAVACQLLSHRGKPGANKLDQRSAVACQLLSHRGKPGANKLGQRSAVACQLLSHRGKPGANKLDQRSAVARQLLSHRGKPGANRLGHIRRHAWWAHHHGRMITGAVATRGRMGKRSMPGKSGSASERTSSSPIYGQQASIQAIRRCNSGDGTLTS